MTTQASGVAPIRPGSGSATSSSPQAFAGEQCPPSLASPVLIVSEVRVIAQTADAIVFVVSSGKTAKPQVEEALHPLESVGQRVTVIVLNQISTKGMKRCGHGGKYGGYSVYGRKYYAN